MSWKKSLLMYGLVVFIGLLVVLFVGRDFDQQTGDTSLTLTPTGYQEFRKGMDVAGGVRLYYKIDLSKYRQLYTNTTQYNQVVGDVQNIILENIDTRVSSLGVSDYESKIQTLEDGQYVVIDLGGVHDLEQAKEIIGKTVELEFKVPYTGGDPDVRARRQLLAESILKEAVTNTGSFQSIAANNAGQEVVYQVHEQETLEELPQIYQDNQDVLATTGVHASLLEGVYRSAEATAGTGGAMEGRVVTKVNNITTQAVNGSGVIVTGAAANNPGVTEQTTYSVEEVFITAAPQWISAKDPQTNEILNGAFFRYASLGQSQTGQTAVLVHFDERGKQIFCNLTAQIIGEQMAIFVGGQPVTAPVIQDKICQGTAQITGQFTSEEAREMIDNLNEGALPAPLILAHEEKVSATLGAQAMRGSIIAGLVGLGLVFAYMLLVYGPRKGTVGIITLISFLIVLFAAIKLVGFALSLSGIAAILLSIGMGVDANILIYERVTEELSKDKSIYQSVIDGYERSRTAIRDGNITTGIIALLLVVVGTNVFKGFGTMMVVNILITLFVLTPMTKYLLLRILGSRR